MRVAPGARAASGTTGAGSGSIAKQLGSEQRYRDRKERREGNDRKMECVGPTRYRVKQ